MPIRTFWHNDEKTIVGYEFDGRWTWEEFHNAVDAVRVMMESVIHQRVDGIIDLSQSGSIPGGSLVHFRKGTSKAADNWGISVVVTNSLLISLLSDTIRRFSPQIMARYFIVKSMDEAFKLIEERRSAPVLTP